MFNSPKQHWYKDTNDFISEMQVDEKKNYFKNVVEKMRYNRAFYENDGKKGMEIRHCAATHLGISGVKHVLLPYNLLTRRYITKFYWYNNHNLYWFEGTQSCNYY